MFEKQPIDLLRLLVTRLERLSADSRWARRASGLRGNIIKVLEQAENGDLVDNLLLEKLTNSAFEILRLAAHDIPDVEDQFLKK